MRMVVVDAGGGDSDGDNNSNNNNNNNINIKLKKIIIIIIRNHGDNCVKENNPLIESQKNSKVCFVWCPLLDRRFTVHVNVQGRRCTVSLNTGKLPSLQSFNS